MAISNDPDIFMPMIDDGEMPPEVLDELEKHFTLLTESTLNSDQLLEILDTHNHEIYECAYCYFLKREKYWLTVEILINKQSERFTSEVIDKCFEVIQAHYSYTPSTAEWVAGDTDKAEQMHYELALLPESSQDQLRSGAENFGFVEAAYLYEEMELTSEDYFRSILNKVAKHPQTSKDIYEQWLESGHEARVGDGRVDADGRHVEEISECAICEEHSAATWTSRE